MKRTPIRLIALVSTAALTLSACGGEESEENSSESTSSSSSSEAGGDESSEGGEQSSQEPSDGASQGAGADGASGSSADPSSSGDASGEAQDADGKKPDPEAAGTLDDLEISGGDKPSITFGDGPFTVSETQDKAVEEGDGEELTTDHTAMVEYALYNGTSGKELQNAFGQNAVPIGLNDEQTIAALRSAMEGKKVGSTIAVAIPAKDAFGEEGAPQLGLEAGDTVVYLMKVTEASKPLKEATGTENTVPLEARTTFGLPQSVTGSAAITASTPAASAVRRMAPRLPGFSRCSATTYSPGPSGCGRSASATPGVGTTARKPSGPSR